MRMISSRRSSTSWSCVGSTFDSVTAGRTIRLLEALGVEPQWVMRLGG